MLKRLPIGNTRGKNLRNFRALSPLQNDKSRDIVNASNRKVGTAAVM